MHLDFSTIKLSGPIEKIEQSFDHTCNLRLDTVTGLYRRWFQDMLTIRFQDNAAANLEQLLNFIQKNDTPKLYVIIDEYDNFANQLVTTHKDDLYRALTAEDSFLKTFFKTLKEGRKTGVIANIFITGVLPITIDDLTSAFNIATFLTLHPKFENMLGFTQAEVDQLLDEIYHDYEIEPTTRSEVDDVIKSHY